MIQVFYPGTRLHRQVAYKIRLRQWGLCYGCRRLFADFDFVVRGSSRKPRYYHLACARRFKITDEKELAAMPKLLAFGGRAMARSVRRSVKREYLRLRDLGRSRSGHGSRP